MFYGECGQSKESTQNIGEKHNWLIMNFKETEIQDLGPVIYKW